MTDGLDTTDATPEQCISRSLQNHCPLYFCVGQGQAAPRETLLVRELDVPKQVLRKSQFTAQVVVEAHARQARDVPVSLGWTITPWRIPGFICTRAPTSFPGRFRSIRRNPVCSTSIAASAKERRRNPSPPQFAWSAGKNPHPVLPGELGLELSLYQPGGAERSQFCAHRPL